MTSNIKGYFYGLLSHQVVQAERLQHIELHPALSTRFIIYSHVLCTMAFRFTMAGHIWQQLFGTICVMMLMLVYIYGFYDATSTDDYDYCC